MGVWDITTPSGNDPKSQGDDRIREMKAAIEEALQGGDTEGVEAIFPGDSPSTAPVYRYRGLKGSTGSRPTSGQYGMYFDTDRNVLQRDNGSTWDDVATVIPAGTVMPFYQAAAPAGWTQVTTQNDKVFRVVSGTGGGAGGTIATSATLAHSHTVNSHTHSIGEPQKTSSSVSNENPDIDVGSSNYLEAFGSTSFSLRYGSHKHGGATGAQNPGTDSQLGVLAYIDIILASKD